MMMNKLSLILLICVFSGCQNVKEGFLGTKKNNSDEFLVEKKNPLILPPDFTKLPIPKNSTNNFEDTNDKKFNLKSVLKNKEIKEETETESSSLENSILKKIRRN
tara:strand:- start:2999 stop:3313 length:315 start_codon:yes stop_codon:yes gene_type:complete